MCWQTKTLHNRAKEQMEQMEQWEQESLDHCIGWMYKGNEEAGARAEVCKERRACDPGLPEGHDQEL